jgi:hypothetical protein
MSMLENHPKWIKSSLSFANGNCVEVADLVGGEIGVRNSRDPEGPALRFTRDEWDAFIGGCKLGEFDLDEDGHLARQSGKDPVA